MDTTTLVTPPYVAGPFRLEPFPALMLIPARVGDPSTGRAFARPYKEVAARLRRWQRKGLVEHDATAALHLHEYTANGITIRGLVGRLDVSRRATRAEDRVVLPHEGIHPAQADELADRMAEMEMNPAPILLVHRGTAGLRALLTEVMQAEPDRAFTDRSRQRHRIWTIRTEEALAAIAAELATTRALIADGHHRYAAYLRLQSRDLGPAYDSGLAMLVDHLDTPLFLGAIHRRLHGTNLADVQTAALALGHGFRLADRPQAVAALGGSRLVVTDGAQWAVLQLNVPAGRAAVEVFHGSVIPAGPHGPSRIGYHHTVEDALAGCTPGDSVAVLLPSTTVDETFAIAEADRLLPEKATSFQPKPSLGVLIRSLTDRSLTD